MYNHQGRIVFSPSDLTTFMASTFASWMDRYQIEQPNECPRPDQDDALNVALQHRGLEYERALLDEFTKQGQAVAVIEGDCVEAKITATREALQNGVSVIYQACLDSPPMRGYADFLVKVPGKSDLGDYHYEVWDTKLTNVVKPKFVIQLCCYAEMLQSIQGIRPEHLVVAMKSGEKARLRTSDYFAYYAVLKTDFLHFQQAFAAHMMPDPSLSKSYGRWSKYAEALLSARDHLSQIANIRRSQIIKLNRAGIETVQQLAESDTGCVAGMNENVLGRLRSQARIQRASAGMDIPQFELLIHAAGERKGLALLPPHSPLDVFFDIEGFPLEEDGLEYLWGCSYFDESGERQFRDFWAHDHEQEKWAFIAFIQWVYKRWQQDPSMHIYHYASYEITACRKLMGRYGVCENEVDNLLRNEVFVDLYKVVVGGLLIGEPAYSIKNVEHLYRGRRDTQVTTGGDSVVVYESWQNHPDGDTWQTSSILKAIRDYNIDDCDSTQELTAWLRQQQANGGISYLGKTPEQEKELSEEITKRTQLRDTLLDRAETLKAANPDQSLLTETLAWLLEFHRRENKPMWWRLFDRLGLSHEDLLDDIDCLAACKRTDHEPFKTGPRKKKEVFEYHFDPNQETKTKPQSMYVVGGEDKEKVDLVAIDFDAGLVQLEAMTEPPAELSLIPDEFVPAAIIEQSIERFVQRFADGELGHCAALDFLERRAPRIHNFNGGPILKGSSSGQLDEIIQVVKALNNSYLTIQGPPGAGKTYTGKHVIAALVRDGKRVGICSNSHKAINNLLKGVASYCKEIGLSPSCVCTKETDAELLKLGINIGTNAKITDYLESGCVIGTTAWGFAREDVANQLDYLFIDEAGQVSVANLVAISQATKNLVLMGDQMQLGQPSQGSHPGQSGLSILDYLLHDQPTIPEDMGVFLGTTYRMHPKVNKFISDAIYEGKLTVDESNRNQTIAVPEGYQGMLNREAGIIHVPVMHEGNTQAADEEVAAIVELAHQLIGRTFTSKACEQRTIDWSDMLFVAPYNHQVNKLQQALGVRARVGSVDKFQGQEAPVVFLSMCTSDASESPRGMDFLFDEHRINVAISRAQSLAIVIAHPGLVTTPANSLKQMRKINVIAKLFESGR